MFCQIPSNLSNEKFFFIILLFKKFFEFSLKSRENTVTPQILPFSFGDDPLNTEDVAAVQCMVLKGDLPLKISWFLNAMPITTVENGIHVVMTSPRISQLTIESVTAYHRGNYRCVAENKAGSAQYIAELRANGTLCLLSSMK